EGHHLGGVVDLDIAPANRPQRIDCLSRNLMDVACHLDGEIEQGTRLGINRSLAVISLDLVRQFGVACYGTEILSVGLRSIKTIVRPRGYRRKHLALAARETSRAVHQRDVEPRRSGEHGRVQALHPEYVEDTPGALFCLLVEALEFTSRLVWGDGVDPGHRFLRSRQTRRFYQERNLTEVNLVAPPEAIEPFPAVNCPLPATLLVRPAPRHLSVSVHSKRL